MSDSVQQLVTFHTVDRDDRSLILPIEQVVVLMEEFKVNDEGIAPFTLSVGVDDKQQTMWHFVHDNIVCIEIQNMEVVHETGRAVRPPAKSRRKTA